MSEAYKDPRWQKRRLEIMQRDGWACCACGNTEQTLHVHHKRYVGELWESPDEDLQTLCESCHGALGRHPKAGMAWIRGEDGPFIVIQHCPGCAYPWVRETDGVLSCCQCDWVFEIRSEVLFSMLEYHPGKAGG